MSTVNREIAVQPLNEPACPTCGGPNGCAVAASGRFEVDCWCKTASFSAELLARVPDSRKNKACICRTCAEGACGPRADPDNPAGAAATGLGHSFSGGLAQGRGARGGAWFFLLTHRRNRRGARPRRRHRV